MALPLSYNWRNLFVRKLSTALTFTVVGVIVAVLCILLSFAAGIRVSLRSSGSPLNVMVLKTGATAESTSIITPEEANRLVQTPGIAQDDRGQMLISQELCAQTSIPRKGPEGNPANVAVRGVDDAAYAIHPEVKVVEGRGYEPGALEVIVGRQAQDRYRDLHVGGQVQLGRAANRTYTVVGVFEAGGGAFESEIWGSRPTIMDSYNRRFISSAVLRLADASNADAAIKYLKGPAVRLNAKLETDYYEDLSSKTQQIVALTSMLIGIMAIGAVFAVANTMYASVDSRRREIAMLRTIGFTRTSIITSFLLESILICLFACATGVAAGSLVDGSRQDFLSDSTWTVLAYELRLTPDVILSALGVAMAVGLIGGLAPALKASRIGIIEALRKA
ncbi:hypothetical protein B7486_08490 [cyanobacterium TDX16]|nr:hypothetical protein B7486_08490 [cyanobacterium TDX16]